jgi:hypothetical protein
MSLMLKALPQGAEYGTGKKMLKAKVDPTMCMKTKRRMTICRSQKTPFQLGFMLFYTETHVLCRNRQHICRNLRPGERIPRFKIERL